MRDATFLSEKKKRDTIYFCLYLILLSFTQANIQENANFHAGFLSRPPLEYRIKQVCFRGKRTRIKNISPIKYIIKPKINSKNIGVFGVNNSWSKLYHIFIFSIYWFRHRWRCEKGMEKIIKRHWRKKIMTTASSGFPLTMSSESNLLWILVWFSLKIVHVIDVEME